MALKDMKKFKEELNSVGIMSWQDRLFTDWDAFNSLLSRLEMETSLDVRRMQARVNSAHVAVPVVFNETTTTHVFWFVSQAQLDAYKYSYITYAETHPQFKMAVTMESGEGM